MSVDLDSAGNQSDSVNVLVRPALGFQDSDLTKLESTLQAQYSQLGSTVLSTKFTSVDAHRTLEISILQPFKNAAGNTTEVDETQYFLTANSFLYAITCSSRSANSAFTTIVDSFSV